MIQPTGLCVGMICNKFLVTVCSDVGLNVFAANKWLSCDTWGEKKPLQVILKKKNKFQVFPLGVVHFGTHEAVFTYCGPLLGKKWVEVRKSCIPVKVAEEWWHARYPTKAGLPCLPEGSVTRVMLDQSTSVGRRLSGLGETSGPEVL